MGQARIRKLNGTYPTKAQIAAMEAQRQREATTIWHPTADDLPFSHISEDARPQLRERLKPWLANLYHADILQGEKGWKIYRALGIAGMDGPHRVGVQGGHCWEVAQALMVAAKGDPGVVLVEGVWNRPWQIEEGDAPAPHTWCVVDGHRVDLIGEFYDWKNGDNEWVYEPLAEYTYSDLVKLFGDGPDDDGYVPDGFDISTIKAWDSGTITEEMLPEHLRSDREPDVTASVYERPEGDYDPKDHVFVAAFERWKQSEGYALWTKDFEQFTDERNDAVNAIVFKPASDRLQSRYLQAAQEQAVAA